MTDKPEKTDRLTLLPCQSEDILHLDLACRNLLIEPKDKGYTVKVQTNTLTRTQAVASPSHIIAYTYTLRTYPHKCTPPQISDFGLSKVLADNPYYKSTSDDVKIPVNFHCTHLNTNYACDVCIACVWGVRLCDTYVRMCLQCSGVCMCVTLYIYNILWSTALTTNSHTHTCTNFTTHQPTNVLSGTHTDPLVGCWGNPEVQVQQSCRCLVLW